MTLRSAKRGFTLIELLVVIAIIGILSSVVLASLGTAREKARDATRISDIKNIQLALELYYDSRQSYPGQTTNALYAATGLLDAAAWTTNPFSEAGNYIPNIPVDPLISRGATFAYSYIGVDAAGTAVCFGAFSGNAPVPCQGYLLGASLERSDNPVLNNDVDATVAPFYGADAGVCGANGAVTNGHCYAVRP
jgi:prepilin-type N-terminal cleavage/methylation domain-containing protein